MGGMPGLNQSFQGLESTDEITGMGDMSSMMGGGGDFGGIDFSKLGAGGLGGMGGLGDLEDEGEEDEDMPELEEAEEGEKGAEAQKSKIEEIN